MRTVINVISACICCIALLLALACGSGGASSPTPSSGLVSVSINPPTTTLSTEDTCTFSASVANAIDASVTWSVQEPDGGSVDKAGLYTAPSSVDATRTVHVVATSNADKTKSATATVTVEKVVVSISPNAVLDMNQGEQLQFSATVTGTTANQNVTWEATKGTISETGLYTAPNESGKYKITAKSKAYPRKLATVEVEVYNSIAITIDPTTATVNQGATKQFNATVTGTVNKKVTWTATGGTIATGLFTAPTTAGTYTITAKSSADTTKTATATVTVSSVLISISPEAQTLYSGESYLFTANVTGTTNTSVTWSIQEGSTGGTVVASGSSGNTGKYSAPLTVSGTFHVVATSVADTSKKATATVTVNPNVYAGGYKGTASGPLPGYWKNGLWQSLSAADGTYGKVQSLVVSGGSVYAGGYVTTTPMSTSNDVPGYWVDGKWHKCSTPYSYDGRVNSLFVLGDVVYTGGYLIGSSTSSKKLPVYWMGTSTYNQLPHTSSNCDSGEVLSLEVVGGSDTKVYSRGYIHNPSTYDDYAGYWTNDTWSGLTSSGQSRVTSGKCYFTKHYLGGFKDYQAGYWTLSVNPTSWSPRESLSGSSTVNSLQIYQGTVYGIVTVYAGGFSKNGANVQVACYWMGDQRIDLMPTTSNKNSFVQSLVVSGGVVYAGGAYVDGNGHSIAAYWQQDEKTRISLSEDVSYDSGVNSLVVQ